MCRARASSFHFQKYCGTLKMVWFENYPITFKEQLPKRKLEFKIVSRCLVPQNGQNDQIWTWTKEK